MIFSNHSWNGHFLKPVANVNLFLGARELTLGGLKEKDPNFASLGELVKVVVRVYFTSKN